MANTGFEKWRAAIDARVIDTSEEEQSWTTNTIHKVPAYLRDCNPEAFTPKVVSFGPYHHDYEKLQLMEVHKERAVVHFIKRAGQPLENLIQKVRRSVKTLRVAYSCLDEKWMTDEDAFVKMMILDGCFMYEISFSCNEAMGYSNMDPFFARNSYQKSIIIRNDMLLIENQLPVTLLRTLASFDMPQAREDDLTRLINRLAVSLGFSREQLYHGAIATYRGSHLLDVCLKTHFSPKLEEETDTNSSSAITIVCHSALELHEAGVRFKKSETENFDDVHFNTQNGTFHLPQLIVEDNTERIFLNMIAFEQLHPRIGSKFVSYIWLMTDIIGFANDVRLLRQSGVIKNLLGSDEDVALLFNRITKNVIFNMDRNSMMQVREDLSMFCGKRRNKWRASLNHTYFKSPWTVISLVGVVLVILLTVIQTICAIIQV